MWTPSSGPPNFGQAERVSLRAVASLVGLALPVDCAGCGRPDLPLCAPCLAVLDAPARGVRRGSPGAPPVFACADYGDILARVITAWKDRGRHDLSRPLSRALARSVVRALEPSGSAAGRDGVWLVPVPSSGAARRRRGEHLVRRLALSAADRVRAEQQTLTLGGGPSVLIGVANPLRFRVQTADQSGLTAAQRSSNLAGAIAVRSRARAHLTGRTCIVVDDVITTGATALEATRALQDAGAHVVAISTVCTTPLRRRLSTGIEQG